METPAYSYTYSSSRWGGYFLLLLALGLLVVLSYSFANHTAKQEGVIVFLLAITVLFVWFGLKTIRRKQPALQFGEAGIWTPKLGNVEWEKVLIKLIHVPSRFGRMYSLNVLGRTNREQLDWVTFGTDKAEIDRVKAALSLYSKAKII